MKEHFKKKAEEYAAKAAQNPESRSAKFFAETYAGYADMKEEPMNQVVWMVWGDPNAHGGMPNLWETKLLAEMYARQCFPNENPDIRYGRIFYREVLQEVDV